MLSKKRKRALSGSSGGGARQAGQLLADLGNHVADHAAVLPIIAQQILRRKTLRVSPHDLHPGPESRRAFAFVTPAHQHLHVADVGVQRQLFRQARLAAARFAAQEYQTALARASTRRPRGAAARTRFPCRRGYLPRDGIAIFRPLHDDVPRPDEIDISTVRSRSMTTRVSGRRSGVLSSISRMRVSTPVADRGCATTAPPAAC